jgi:hypothetical protein
MLSSVMWTQMHISQGETTQLIVIASHSHRLAFSLTLKMEAVIPVKCL